MKTFRIFSLVTLFLAAAGICFAQQKTETLKVSGECGMCKKKIEKASKDAGASYALWNKDTKVLTVKYSSSSTNLAKIETKIASVGYDTPDIKATDEAYNKLDQCCQYEREASANGTAVSGQEKNSSGQEGIAVTGTNAGKKKDGKAAMTCSDDKSCCKDGKKTATKKKAQ